LFVNLKQTGLHKLGNLTLSLITYLNNLLGLNKSKIIKKSRLSSKQNALFLNNNAKDISILYLIFAMLSSLLGLAVSFYIRFIFENADIQLLVQEQLNIF